MSSWPFRRRLQQGTRPRHPTAKHRALSLSLCASWPVIAAGHQYTAFSGNCRYYLDSPIANLIGLLLCVRPFQGRSECSIGIGISLPRGIHSKKSNTYNKPIISFPRSSSPQTQGGSYRGDPKRKDCVRIPSPTEDAGRAVYQPRIIKRREMQGQSRQIRREGDSDTGQEVREASPRL